MGTERDDRNNKKIGDKWLLLPDGKPRKVKSSGGKEFEVRPFCVGDISLFSGGNFPSHKTHQKGDAVDLNCSMESNINNTTRFTTEQDLLETFELMKLFEEEKVKRILFNCHYVISKIKAAEFCSGHSNHVHIDGPMSHKTSPDNYQKKTTCVDCSLFDKCEERIFKFRLNAKVEWSKAEEYDRDKKYEIKGVCVWKDKDGNILALSKRESDRLNDKKDKK
ncbi:MAG: hypothetical protein N2053_00705 [Chitinispirillaceae bacterium]|nr:hypothetical protein [Chitinispirillaceae bacterium]